MTQKERNYPAIFFRQRPNSPVQCVLVATSADIDDWASVPTKESGDLRQFQRPEIEAHVQEIAEFFKKHDSNCSPSSIVVGFRSSPEALDASGNSLKLDDIRTGEPVHGQLRIRFFAPAEMSEEQQVKLLASLREQEIERLTSALEAYGADAVATSTDNNEAEPALGEPEPIGVDDPATGEAVDIAEMARSKEAYLKALKDLSPAKLDEKTRLRTLRALLEFHKPGLIIDGQHRVKGTRSEQVHFSVTALPDAGWEELAFQFIVLNKAAKKVPDSLLINIVGNSLTPKELQQIERRLDDSGIPVPLYQGVMKIHEDPESPFYQKLRFGLDDETGIIDAASAKTRIVNFWFKCKHYSLFQHLIPEGKTKTEKLQRWQASGLWYEFFKAFWLPAKRFYEENSSLWGNEVDENDVPTSRLMQVMILSLTQETIVAYLRNVLEKEIRNDITQQKSMATLLPDLDAFRQRSEFYFKRVKPEFFQDWGAAARGFGGSKAIKDAYCEALTLVISGDDTISNLKNKKPQHLLFRP